MNTLLLTIGPPIGYFQQDTPAPITDQNGNDLMTDQGADLLADVLETVAGPIPYGPMWDLCLDAYGNIAMASAPYAIAQDVASALKTFAGEVWYDTMLGIPYLTQVLGQNPPISLLKKLFTDAALTVPGVVTAQAFITGISNRQLTGTVQITDTNGVQSNVGF